MLPYDMDTCHDNLNFMSIITYRINTYKQRPLRIVLDCNK